MQSDKGEKGVKEICSLDVLFNEIPKLIGSIDGCQQAVNETRNKVEKFGDASVETLKSIATNVPELLRIK